MKKALLALTIILVSCSLAFLPFRQASAQGHTVSGTVTGSDGSGIPGITVQIKGTNSGTATDVNGHFQLTAADDATLVFRGIGYAQQEIAIDGKSTIDVTMSANIESLNEVVVVGYGTTTRKAFTGSVKTVSAKAIENKDVANIGDALAGEVPGVRIINGSGQPGEAPTIRIRGFGSVNGNRDPLYVIDGVPYTGYSNTINPADVKSINVLTDAVATAIYGARGANGVILITTKDGKGQKPFVEVDFKYGTNKRLLPGYDEIHNPDTYVGLVWEGLYNANKFYPIATGDATHNPAGYANAHLFTSKSIDPGYNLWNVTPDSLGASKLIDPQTHRVRSGIGRTYTPYNWADYAFQPANRTETNIKLGGGDERTSYYTSLGYLDADGYSIKSDFKRISARVNLEHKVNSWLSSKMNLSYSRTITNNNGQDSSSNSVFWFTDNMPPIYPLFLRDANHKKVGDPIFGGYQYDYGAGGSSRSFGGLTNAIADAIYNTSLSKRHNFNGQGSVKVKFLQHFNFISRFGLQYYNDAYYNLVNKFYGSAASTHGSIEQDKQEMVNYDWLNIVHYSQSFGRHNVKALAAHEATSWKTHYLSAFKDHLVRNDNLELDNAVVSYPTSSHTNEYQMESWFGQVNYNYDGTYYLSASIRRDGSSRFVKDKWGTFGSVGIGWLMSNEDFMNSVDIIKYLKLKASYGLIGDQAGVGYYPGYNLSSVGPDGNGGYSISFSDKGNPNLTWETSKIFQVGTEFQIGSFLNGSVDYFIKNTDNLIFDFRAAPSLGYATIQVNDGQLRNQGLEFDLTGHILSTGDFRLDLGVNGQILKNEITHMPMDPSTGKEKAIDVEGSYGWSVGHSIYDFYMHEFTGVDPNDGASTWRTYYHDDNGNGEMDEGESIADLKKYKSENPGKMGDLKTTTSKDYTEATDFYVGKSAIPKVRGGINLHAQYKGFSLAVQMLYGIGGYGYDGLYSDLMQDVSAGGNNWSTDILKRWQKEGDITDVPKLTNGQASSVNSLSTRFLTKEGYLMLNNVRLGYTFPDKLVGKYFQSLSVWISGDNLWLHSSRKGFNPLNAQDGGSARYLYPPLSTLSAGIKIRF